MQLTTLADFRGNAVPHRATRAGMIGFLSWFGKPRCQT